MVPSFIIAAEIERTKWKQLDCFKALIESSQQHGQWELTVPQYW
jgi:hypothetical protein